MKRFTHEYLYCMMIIFLLSCTYTDNHNYHHNLLLCDSISTPDRCLSYLSNLDINTFKSDKDKAYYAMLYTRTLYRLNIHATSDSLISIATKYYQNSNDSINAASTFYHAAKVYESLNNREQAIFYFNKAIQATPHNNHVYKSTIYLHWAFIMSMNRPYEISFDLLEKAKYHAEIINNKELITDILIQEGWHFLNKEKYDSAMISYNDALKTAFQLNDDYYIFQASNRLAECYAEIHEFDTAIAYTHIAKEHAKILTHKKQLNSTYGLIYSYLKQWDKAERYIHLSADTSTNLNKAIYYQKLTQLYIAKKDHSKMSTYCSLYTQYLDSVYREREKNNAAEFQKKYDNFQIRLENNSLKIQNQQWYITCLTIIILSIIAGGMAWLFFTKHKKRINDIIQAHNDAFSASTEKLQSKIIELQETQQQLVEKENELMFHISTKQSLLMTLSLKEEELQKTRKQRQELKQRIFSMNDVINKIQKFKQTKVINYNKNHILDCEDLSTLIEMTNLCYNDAITRLSTTYQGLTDIELYICCLLFMDMPNPKIALLLNITDDALKQRKYRIKRNKLQITDPDISLEIFLSNFSRQDTT